MVVQKEGFQKQPLLRPFQMFYYVHIICIYNICILFLIFTLCMLTCLYMRCFCALVAIMVKLQCKDFVRLRIEKVPSLSILVRGVWVRMEL